MKHLILWSALAFSLISCDHKSGSGHIITETRETGDFSGVEVGGAFEVEITRGPVTAVTVESDDNIIKDIETKVSNGKLKIRTRNNGGFNDAHFRVFITAPHIKMLDVSGAARVKVKDALVHDGQIELEASGASEIGTAVDAPSVDARVSGAATISLNGRTRTYTANVSGSGTLKSGDLKSENTDVHVSGAGTARVHASQQLKADASGAGNIYYTGGAAVNQQTSGAGNVKKES